MDGRCSAVDGCDMTLRDGRIVHLRPTSMADEAELVQGFERMSQAARYMRWLHTVREPNLERARKGLAMFPGIGIGLVATAPAADGIDIVGTAMAIFAADGPGCEFAVNVDARFGGAGLGTALMTTLIAEARRRGRKEMVGFVLSENRSMLRLAKRLGFSTGPDPHDATVRICRLALDGS